jgi:superfamily II DNA or RNA helicase
MNTKVFIEKRLNKYEQVPNKHIKSAPSVIMNQEFKGKKEPAKKKTDAVFVSSELKLSVPENKMSSLPNTIKLNKPERMNADCIRTTENWISIKRHHRFDKPGFDPKRFLQEMKTMSPKLQKLIENIRRIDEHDLQKYGKRFKHFIFSDVKKGGYGAKIIASGLISAGFNHCFTKTLDVKPPPKNEKNETFGLLSSTSIYDKVFTKKHIQAVTSMYNKRPDNVYGESMRFIVLDSGFKEGIDLFDVKYVHIFENQKSGADLTQAIGRATRTCGQSGLQFVKNHGWKLHVYQYFLLHEDNTTWFDDYMMHDGNDLNSLHMISSIEKMMVRCAVDHDLNYSINNQVPLEVQLSHETHSHASSHNENEIIPIGFNYNTREGNMELVPYNSSNKNIIPIGFHDDTDDKSNQSKAIVPLGYKYNKDGSKQIVPLGFKYSSDDLKQIVPYGFDFESTINNNKKIVPYGYEFSENGSKQIELLGYEYVSNSGRGSIQKTNNDNRLLEYMASVNVRNKMFDTDAIDKMSFEEFMSYINKVYDKYKYKPIKIENHCVVKKSDVNKDKRIIEFSESQNFVTHYFIPNHFAKGLLVWHSVGTGKTCTAVSVKSFLFEKSDYSIIWVTRTTLKSDIWKNMYDQICDHIIREKALQGVHEDDFRKYMSKRFLPPMSYKQFSNVLEKKNAALYERLSSVNGKEDILRNTLVIIDEAHKLYGGDLSGNEKPKMSVIEEHIRKSKSCKVLLMTGTPVVKDPMEFSKLMNLIIKKEENKFPTNIVEFQKRFLNGSEFTDAGVKLFQNNIKGLISHLDKRFDPRQFAQPEFHKVPVMNSMYSGISVDDCIANAEKTFAECVQSTKSKVSQNNPNYADEIYSLESEIEKMKDEKKKYKRSDPMTLTINEKMQTAKEKVKDLKRLLRLAKQTDKEHMKKSEKEEKLCGKTYKKNVSDCQKITESEKDSYQNIAFSTLCVKKRSKRTLKP